MIKITKRLVICTLAGILLGVFCIIGGSIRFGAEIAPYMLFSLWFNTLVENINMIYLNVIIFIYFMKAGHKIDNKFND